MWSVSMTGPDEAWVTQVGAAKVGRVPRAIPAGGAPATAEQCECKGFTVVGDIGDGQVACPEGLTEVSRIQYGIEGGVCCN